ncbi:MAG: NAD(P)-dependent oxidoreductase [Chloroflexi bacterium]|nr:NAD(P)-dependent oxidoreductase [Chloroflexota bacterium]
MGREYPESNWAPALSPSRARTRTVDVRERVWTFEEVELGYSLTEALVEADRCLRCPEPSCVIGCPAHNDIPNFIHALRQGDLVEGIDILRRTTNFPGICGRVCDKLRQCEGACVLAREGGDPVAIGPLERFLADRELEESRRLRQAEWKAAPTGKKVAIVGSGPSGLAAAGDLALRGHEVVVFEALPVPGGALAWGIPAFRLPPPVVEAEIEYLRRLNVVFQPNTKVGTNPSIEDVLRGFDAVFVGAGANVSTTLGIPGEGLEGIYTATEFLSRAKLSRTHQLEGYQSPVVGERLAVIGAGNTAMDVAQTALRLGFAELQELASAQATMDVAETAMRLGFREVTVVYRRSEAEMPARKEEVESAREEGVRFRFLSAPIRFLGGEGGHVRAMECIQMELGKPDRRGRREPVPKPGSEFTVNADTVIMALGYQPEPILAQSASGLTSDQRGLLTVDRATGRTSRQGVWAGGDIVTGADTVVRAMVAGKKAAEDIDRYLQSQT